MYNGRMYCSKTSASTGRNHAPKLHVSGLQVLRTAGSTQHRRAANHNPCCLTATPNLAFYDKYLLLKSIIPCLMEVQAQG